MQFSKDIEEVRKPDMQLSGGCIYQAEAQLMKCRCPEVHVCLVHPKSGKEGLLCLHRVSQGESVQ